MDSSEPTQPIPDVVCTLGKNARASQELEWADLSEHALTSELIEGGVASTYPIELAPMIESLANREVACCGSWLDSKITYRADTLRLEITTTNPDGRALILALAGLSP